ncbi:LamG-like jellyroll fold domain-containing protein [Flavobacterium sp. CF136]|uniref:LamG-like jellyroll fold domain-containing protein n=1 Tax=Flavobacterium sp. (strain CF136) TaxID=1144313 RepID=UPI000271A768|nr:LamG-like jellyroll fold domain-containing protein [Flavobacterium sp. CF136]EJL66319.1 hypothetical protein PMI10_00667 [Flavobacterium sp. CF136]
MNLFQRQILGNKKGINASLSAYYKLDGNANESTGLSPNGSATGIDYVAGKTGSAARFDSSTDRIDIADTNSFSFTDGVNDLAFSMSMWVNFTVFTVAISGSTYGNWLINKRGTGTNNEWQLVLHEGELKFFKFNASGSIYQGIKMANPFSLNTWYNLVYTDDGSKTNAGMKFYINSVLQTVSNNNSGTYTGMTNGTNGVRIGLNSWDLSSPYLRHQGYIEEVGVSKNKALNQSEIDYVYNGGNSRTYPY